MTQTNERKHTSHYSYSSSSYPDSYTRVLPDPTSNISLNNPILIAGFPDEGMIGSISLNHIIEDQAMHQIAAVESEHIMPAAMFIGKRFRHPFRIYANESGTVCAVICEVPVIARGIFSLIHEIIDWSIKVGTSEVLVLGSISPTNFSPPIFEGRKPVLLQNGVSRNRNYADKTIEEIQVPDGAIIVGLAGSLLSLSASCGTKCTALMVPTILNSPDPEGAAILLEALAKTTFGIKMDTTRLRNDAESIKKRLNEFIKMHQNEIKEQERAASSDMERIYK